MRNIITKRLLLVSILFFCVAMSAQTLQPRHVNTKGTEFWVVFMKNSTFQTNTELELNLIATAEKNSCNVVVSNPNTNWSKSQRLGVVGRQQNVLVDINEGYVTNPSNVGQNIGLKVTATDTISLYAFNFGNASSDVACILPVDLLGNYYILQSYAPDDSHNEFAILATEDAIVEITPSVDLNAGTITYDAGSTYTVSLKEGQTLFLTADLTSGNFGDISGTKIRTQNCEKIAVFCGDADIQIPTSMTYPDHIYEQAYPVKLWGKSFVVTNTFINTSSGKTSDRVKITASEDNTTIKINGMIVFYLDEGESYEYTLDNTIGSAFIETSNPSAVYLYMEGTRISLSGDPAMIWIPPVDAMIQSAYFSKISSGLSVTYGVSSYKYCIIVNSTDTSRIQLNGSSLYNWTKVNGNEAYAFIIKDFSQVQVSNHIITGANFLAFVYGEGEQNAFGYTMGVTAKLPNSKMFVNGIDIEDVSNVKTQFCVGDSIILNAKTSVAYDTIVWLLGDGNRLTGETIKYAYNDSGNFTISMQVVVNSAECPLAEVKFDVLIKKNPNSSITTIKSEICEGDSVTLIAPSDYTSYVWNNATTTTLNSLVIYPTTDTNFYVDVYDEFGCDSISDTILIVVNKRPIADLTTSNSTICQGDSIVLRVSSSVNDTSFQWNTGLTTELDSLVLFPTRDSSYCVKVTNDHGCDSTSNVLSVIVNPIYKDTIIESICNGDSYTFHGKDYTQDTIHTDTLQTIKSCDSIVTLVLTILPTYDDTTVTEICQEEVYPFSGTNYDQTGIYTHRLKTTAGCDSIVTLNLTVNPIYRDTTFIEICQGELYTFRGKDYDQTGLYADSLKTVSCNCDSIFFLHLTVNPIYKDTIIESICNGDSYTFHGKDYTQDTIHTDTLQTIKSCDSLVTLILTILPTYDDTTVTEICQEEVYPFSGTNYDQTGIYTHRLKTTAGCDSIVTLNLTVNPIYRDTTFIEICQGELYTFRGKDYDQTGLYADSLKTVSCNCDSIYFLHLTVNPTYKDTIIKSICNGDSYTFHGKDYTQDTIHTDTLQTINSCDSLVTLILTILPTYDDTTVTEICQEEVYPFSGTNYDQTGIYTHRSKTTAGCDSIVTLHLTVNPIYRDTTFIEICQGELYTFRGKDYDQTGIYTDSLKTVSCNCDSIKTLHLIVNPTYKDTIFAEICQGEVYTFNGNDYVQTGLYTDSLTTIHGCDSIVTLNLIVYPTYVDTFYMEICQGEQYTFREKDYDQTGIYTDSLKTMYGCDSLLILNLIVHPIYYDTTFVEICQGEQYTFRGKDYDQTGIYADSLTTIHGCDSIYFLHLIVYPIYNETITAEICFGDIYSFNGNDYDQSGSYTANLKTTHGCDSIVTLNLIVNPLPSVRIRSSVQDFCEGDSVILEATLGYVTYMWNTGHITSKIIVWPEGDTTFKVSVTDTNGCESSTNTNLTLHPRITIDGTTTPETCQRKDGTITVIASIEDNSPLTYRWIEINNVTENPTNLIAGTYNVIVSDGICEKRHEFIVEHEDAPVADFISSSGYNVPTKTPFILRDATIGTPIEWLWDLGDGRFSFDDTVAFSYDIGGQYTVLLQVKDKNGCIDTIIKEFHVYSAMTVYIANAFTPNGDGINDTWRPILAEQSAEYYLTVIDRWGQKVFYSEDPNEEWDGTFNGRFLDNNTVFVYHLRVKDVWGLFHEYSGSISLMR